MKLTCEACNERMLLRYENVTHQLFGKQIHLLHVPIMTCPTCKEEDYQDARRVRQLMGDAYRKDLTEIEYDVCYSLRLAE